MGDEQSKSSQEFLDQHTDAKKRQPENKWSSRNPDRGRTHSISGEESDISRIDTSHASRRSIHTDKLPLVNGNKSVSRQKPVLFNSTKKSRFKTAPSFSSQAKQMQHISASVPDVSGLDNGKLKSPKTLGKKKKSPLSEKKTGQITFKKKIDKNRNSLMSSQLVFASSAEESQDEQLNGTRRDSSASSESSGVGKPRCSSGKYSSAPSWNSIVGKPSHTSNEKHSGSSSIGKPISTLNGRESSATSRSSIARDSLNERQSRLSSGSFTEDERQSRPLSGSFTEDERQSRPSSGSFTVDERQSRPSRGSLTVNEASNALDGVDLDQFVQQYEEMKKTLTQLQTANQHILNTIDDGERENEEWISLFNKKTSGIQRKLLIIKEKISEDETTLQQLTDLVTTIHQKLEDIDMMIQTEGGVESNSVANDNHTLSNRTETLDLENEVEVSDIDIASLPLVTKDRKGYKQRCTERRNDNRRHLRKERKSGKVIGDEGNTLYTDNSSFTDNNTQPGSDGHQADTLSSRVSEVPHETITARKSPRRKSLFDSRDDYRNLPVIASGDRVYASMPQEILPDPQQFWLDLAAREKEAARSSTLPRQNGGENFLVLDTSASMEGGAFTELIQTARNYINGLTVSSSVTRENLCIIEVGQRTMTRVLIHMTNDPSLLLSALDELKPGGMSPIAASLVVVKDLIQKVNTNIVVMSDGKMTPIHIRVGNDLPELYDEQIKFQMNLLGLGFQQLKCRLFFIPIGPYDSSQMEDLVKMTGGEEILPRNINRVYNWTRNNIIAIKLVEDFRRENPGAVVDEDKLQHVVEEIAKKGEITPEEAGDICKALVAHAESTCSFIECDINMPPLGTRVQRGNDWMWGNQDCNMPGTIVSHTNDGHIWVEWDHGLTFRYRYGEAHCYDVMTTEDPRIPVDELISVGCVVTRGEGWKPSNSEDGGPGKTGAVYKVEDNGTVMVRWSNGKIGGYRFDASGSGEIKLCDPLHQRESFEASGGLPCQSTDNDIDPKVAEMNRKNTLKSKIAPKPDDRPAEHTKRPQKHKTGSNERKLHRAGSEDRKRHRAGSQDRKERHSPKMERKQEQPPRTEKTTDECTEVAECPGSGVWQCKDGYGGWKSYNTEHNQKLESAYIKNPKGVSMLTEGKSTYRILFAKLKQVNLKTKEMIDIRRVISPT